MANSCASAASATVRMVVAVSTSRSEKPRSPRLPSAIHENFAIAIHRDVFRLALARERDRHARHADIRPRIPGAAVGVHRTVWPELQGLLHRERRLPLEPLNGAI